MDRSGRFGEMWASASMRRVYEQISRVAGTAVTVLIEGESGTGRGGGAIHPELSRDASGRSSRSIAAPFRRT
jgi:DNA-binding NtrC family response regulator